MQRLVQRLDERQDYETPPELVAALAAEFGPFLIDYAATEANKKAPVCFTPEQDSLAQVWDRPGFLNPPYGKATAAFVKKASEAKTRVVCLLPARTDTRWFHDYVLPKAKVVRFLRGRPKFLLNGKPVLDPKTGRPASGKFPSMVVVFDGHPEPIYPTVNWKGIAIRLARCIRQDDGFSQEEAQIHAGDALDFGCRYDKNGKQATTCQCGPRSHPSAPDVKEDA